MTLETEELETTPKAKEKRQIGFFEATIAVVALGVGLFASTLAIQQKAEIEALKESQIAVETGYTFKDQPDFKRAVLTALDGIVQERQKKDLDEKLSELALASEEAPDGRKIYGNLNARFTLVEFSETECPFCVKHHPTMKNLVDSSKGNINWEWKHLPLGFHNPAAMTQAIVGECVAEQKGNRMFWVYIDEVFKLSEGGGKGVRDLPGLVASLGVDMSEIRKCAAGAKARDIVNADIQTAQSLNISGTPATIIVDNHTGNSQIVSGAQPMASFSTAIKRLMQQAEEAEIKTNNQ